MKEEEIMGALARGYTYPENSHKVLDDQLIMAMTKEVMFVINKEPAQQYEKA